MDLEATVALLALAWLVGSFLLMARSIRRGRDLAEELAARHPATYEALGRPRPGYFESVRRNRFARFVGGREYEDLADPPLAARFEAYRKSDQRLVLSIIAAGAVVALLGLAVQHAA